MEIYIMFKLEKLKSSIIVSIGGITLFTTSCATKPESIAPAYVSHMGYSQYDCEQLAGEQARLVTALSTSSDAQRKARTNDTVGVILLGLPVSSLSGSNQASNISRLKGELEAIQKSMVLKNCDQEVVPVEDIVKKKKKK